MTDIDERFARRRFGTRFVRPDVERDYLAWHENGAVAFTRIGMIASTVNWVLVSLGLPASSQHHLGEMLATIWLGPMPFIALAYALSFSKRWRRWMLFVTALANAAAGLCALRLTVLTNVPLLGLAGVILIASFGFTIFRLRPLPAALATGSYMLACALDAIRARWAGDMTRLVFVTEIVILLAAYQSGLFTSIVLEFLSRRTFRQERIIEAQKAQIERAESLLKRELGHQVAARSRELGRMLATATIVPGRPRVGESFDTRYHIERELGAGAMGAVFEVVRATDNARLALKVVTGEVSPDRAARFAREAEIGARIRHANLVEIVDVGVGEAGVPYLAMELAPNGSLENRRERFGDAAWARPILAGIASGLCALHEAGVVHRDLKPANVLLVDGEVPKISDFGISRFGELDSEVDPEGSTLAAAKARGLTATGMLLGTPNYMAPEAVRGGRVEAPADVFAFGILAMEMLTGSTPFATPPMFRVLAGAPLEVPRGLDALDVDLRELIAAALDENAGKRPTMRALRDLLGVRERVSAA